MGIMCTNQGWFGMILERVGDDLGIHLELLQRPDGRFRRPEINNLGGRCPPRPPLKYPGGAYAPPDPPLNGFAKESPKEFHGG